MIAMTFALGGCAKKVRPYTAKEAAEALTAKAAEIQTVRGRAWISARTPEGKISFPAIIVIDRTQPKTSMLRIEAIDPFGATHVLIILENGQRLTWADYDHRRIFQQTATWHGLPLSRLPELLLGVTQLPDDGRVTAAGEDHFDVSTPTYQATYFLKPSGSTWLLERLEGSPRGAGKYSVRYSDFLGKPDYQLPRDIELSGTSPSGNVEFKISWRERTWNDKIPPELFRVPEAAIKGFAKGTADQ